MDYTGTTVWTTRAPLAGAEGTSSITALVGAILHSYLQLQQKRCQRIVGPLSITVRVVSNGILGYGMISTGEFPLIETNIWISLVLV